jgi:HEAT repeat protein
MKMRFNLIFAALVAMAALGMPATADRVDDLILDLKYGSTDVVSRAAKTLGEIGDPRAVDPLIEVLNTSTQGHYLQSNVAEALGKIGDPRAVDPLANLLSVGRRDREVSTAATKALGEIGGPEAVDALIHALLAYQKAGVPRYGADIALVGIGEPAVKPLTGLLKHELTQTRREAARALGMIGSPIAVDSLVDALNDEDQSVRLAAALALIDIEGSSSDSLVDALKTMHNDSETISPHPSVLRFYNGPPLFTKKSEWLLEDLAYHAESASGVLVKMGDLAVDPLIRAMTSEISPVDSPSYRFKGYAALVLGEIGDPRAVDPLIDTLRSSSSITRQGAATALGEIGDPRAVDMLAYVASRDSDSAVRSAATEALAKIKAE